MPENESLKCVMNPRIPEYPHKGPIGITETNSWLHMGPIT